MDWYFGLVDGMLNGNLKDTAILIPTVMLMLGVTEGFKAIADRMPKPAPKPKHVKPRAQIDWSGWFSGDATHVYYFYDRQGNLLYVGITNDLQRRWSQHAADKPWWHLVARKESVEYSTRAEAERVEAHQIRRLRPQFNRAMNGWAS